ncbi:mitochondrial 50S ribosomal protein L22 [Hysterangium stoloniferum]|nr:mitochondrial 50S ribosomal protein L22 [Hysterangium stoloniferum]
MQRAAAQHVLRAARTRKSVLLSPELAFIGVQCTARRGMANPLNWVRERLQPSILRPLTKGEEREMQKTDEASGRGSLFDEVPKLLEEEEKEAPSVSQKPAQRFSTAHFKISHRKLNMLAKQISGKPLDYAILQMEFSEKRAAKRLKSMLIVARSHATEKKKLDRSKLIVAESWVNKGKRRLKRLDIKGRGKMGLKVHPDSRMTVILREGKTEEEKKNLLFQRRLKKIRSPGLMREDKPLVNIAPRYIW